MPSDDQVENLHMEVKMAVIEGQLNSIANQVEQTAKDMSDIRELLERMVRVEERSGKTQDDLNRAFEAIRTTKESLATLDKAHNKAVGWLSGALFVGALAGGVIQWFAIKQFEPLLALPQQIVALQIEQQQIKSRLDSAEKGSR